MYYLANKITSDWNGYINYDRLNTRILRDYIHPGMQKKETTWIIVFDGLRLDSWEKIVWPELKKYFKLDSDHNFYLATLPSYTNISRVAFFAGSLPTNWKDFNHNYTENHNILLPKLLGFSRDESKQKVKIISRTEEKVEQQELSLDQFQYKALIFNISDTWIHSERGSLIQVNDTIKRKLETLVIPDLDNLIKPEDKVIITSDHGFIELRDIYRISVDDKRDWNDYRNEYESPVYYRYLKEIEHKSGKRIQYDRNTFWTLPVGYYWYDRPKGKPVRYSHGGISMAEMVVPGIMLKKILDRQVILELLIDPISECHEGEEVILSIVIYNRGTIGADVNLVVNASGRILFQSNIYIESDSKYPENIPVRVILQNSNLSIAAIYLDENNKKQEIKRSVNIQIKETDRVKIDTSALDVFENE
jgi:hypothetical protein